MKLRICLAAVLVATLASCGTAPPRTPVLTITQILSDPRKFDRQTVIAEGVLLHRLRKFREAREAYLLLLASNRDSIDQESLACLHHAIGHCSVDLGDFDVADANLRRAESYEWSCRGSRSSAVQ